MHRDTNTDTDAPALGLAVPPIHIDDLVLRVGDTWRWPPRV